MTDTKHLEKTLNDLRLEVDRLDVGDAQARLRLDGLMADIERTIGTPAEAPAHDAVVVEHGVPVAGEPHVALDAARAEADGQAERIEGVLGRVGPRSSVGEPDGRTQRGMTGHTTSMPSPAAFGAWSPGTHDHSE